MKKKIISVIVLLVLIFLGGFAYVLFNANALIAQYKPELQKIATQSLGSPVSLGKISLSVFPQPSFLVDQVSVGASNESTGLAFKNFQLNVRLSALLAKRLEITKLKISQPSITLIKDSKGIRIEGLPIKETEKAPPAASPSSSLANTEKKPQAIPGDLKISLESLEVVNANIVFKDTVQQTTLDLQNINLSVALNIDSVGATIPELKLSTNINGKTPLSVTAESLVFNLQDLGIKIKKLSTDLAGNKIDLSGDLQAKQMRGDFIISSPGIHLEQLAKLFSLLPEAQAKQLASFNLAGQFNPNFTIRLGAPQLVTLAGNIGLSAINADINGFKLRDLAGDIKIQASPQESQLQIENIGFSLNQQPLKIQTQLSLNQNLQTVLKQFTISAFGGSLNLNGAMNLGSHKDFNIKTMIENINLSQALSVLNPQAAGMLSGKLAKFQSAITGVIGDSLIPSLKGSAAVNFVEGKLVGINLAGDVLRATQGLPFLSGNLYGSVPPDQKSELDSNDTAIDSLTSDIQIENAAVTTSNLKLISRIFDLDAKGEIKFDLKSDLRADISFNQQFSKSLVNRVKELGDLLNKDGRLVIPLTISGTLPKVTVLPSLDKLIEVAGKRLLKGKAAEALGNLLGGKKSGNSGGLGGLLGGF